MAAEQTRRRGAALEADILDAVWEEIAEVGYARLTMEGVAARARTGKQVLYRRWANRAELVKAALPHRTGFIVDQVPDTGELREDVLTLLRLMAERQREIGPDVIRGLLAEVTDLDPKVFGIMHDILLTLLQRAVKRGEIPTADLPDGPSPSPRTCCGTRWSSPATRSPTPSSSGSSTTCICPCWPDTAETPPGHG